MGGRGSSSGKSDKGKPYGTEFNALMQSGNVKFVKPTDSKSTKDPLETMTPGRIYASVNEKGQINSISFYGADGKRVKSINLLHSHNEIQGEHTHVGYYHAEKGTRRLTSDEEKLVEYVKKAWYDKGGK